MIRRINEWNRREDPETNPDTGGQLFWTKASQQFKGKGKSLQ